MPVSAGHLGPLFPAVVVLIVVILVGVVVAVGFAEGDGRCHPLILAHVIFLRNKSYHHIYVSFYLNSGKRITLLIVVPTVVVLVAVFLLVALAATIRRKRRYFYIYLSEFSPFP